MAALFEDVMDEFPSIKVIPLTSTNDSSPSRGSVEVSQVMPCFPLEAGEHVRIFPASRDIKLVVSEPRYVAMILELDKSRQRLHRGALPGCLIASQISRAAEAADDVSGEATSVPRRGRLVKLKGLRRESNLNGHVGKLLRYSATKMRWDVDVEDGVGVKAIKPSNFELAPSNTPHKTFTAWRTVVDTGGQWQLAEFGIILRLEELEKITSRQQDEAKPTTYRCTFAAVGRGRIRLLLNSDNWAERSSYMSADVEEVVDVDADVNSGIEELRLMDTLDDALRLHIASFPSAVRAGIHMMGLRDVLSSMGAGRGHAFWKLARFWEGYLQISARAWKSLETLSKLQEADDTTLQKLAQAMPKVEAGGELPESFAFDFGALPLSIRKALADSLELSRLERLRIEEAMPLQQLIQSTSHIERLHLFEAALWREKGRLEAVAYPDGTSLSDAFSTRSDHIQLEPFELGKRRSKL